VFKSKLFKKRFRFFEILFTLFLLASYSEHSEWSVDDAYLQRNVLYYGCCPEPYPDITVELVLKRKPLFYILNLLLPMIFIGLLTLLSFFLPAESGKFRYISLLKKPQYFS